MMFGRTPFEALSRAAQAHPEAPMLQVHDELLLEVPDDELSEVRAHLPRLMSQVAELKVPLVVEVGIGPNWEAAH